MVSSVLQLSSFILSSSLLDILSSLVSSSSTISHRFCGDHRLSGTVADVGSMGRLSVGNSSFRNRHPTEFTKWLLQTLVLMLRGRFFRPILWIHIFGIFFWNSMKWPIWILHWVVVTIWNRTVISTVTNYYFYKTRNPHSVIFNVLFIRYENALLLSVAG